jgi:Zn-dependent M28 family amino/carboxypeptidase
VWATRRSDNASFWSNGFPALLLTDTADLRNPHYHRASDRSETLDYGFMADVVDAVVAALRGMET